MTHDVFFGYGTCPTCWHPLGYTTAGTSNTDHDYAIREDYGGTDTWDFNVDGTTVRASFYFDGFPTADQLQVVVETYDIDSVVPSHAIHSLKKRRFSNGWAAWSGEDDLDKPQPPTPFRAHWNSSTSFQVAIHDTC